MHIEFDVFELMILIFVFIGSKWLFRVLVLLVVARVLNMAKERGKEAIGSLRGGNKQGRGKDSDKVNE